MCGSRHERFSHHQGFCGCSPHYHRESLTKDERIAQLKGYSEELKKELTMVEKRINELGKK